jgi:hypothetical protein
MKKLIFGLTFLGSFLFINGGAMAQASLDPGEGEAKWVCCQVLIESYCTDMHGNGWNRDVKKYQQFC